MSVYFARVFHNHILVVQYTGAAHLDDCKMRLVRRGSSVGGDQDDMETAILIVADKTFAVGCVELECLESDRQTGWYVYSVKTRILIERADDDVEVS